MNEADRGVGIGMKGCVEVTWYVLTQNVVVWIGL